MKKVVLLVFLVCVSGFLLGQTRPSYFQLKDKPILDVVSFDVLGNGTDEGAEINAAIASATAQGAKLLFQPNKTYLTSRQIEITGDDVSVDGNMSTIYSTGTGAVLLASGTAGKIQNIEIKNFTLKGTGLASCGLWLNGVVRSNIENVYVYDVASIGICLTWCVLDTFKNVGVSNNVTPSATATIPIAFYAGRSPYDRTQACVIENISCEAPASVGIYLDDTGLMTFNGGTAETVNTGVLTTGFTFNTNFFGLDLESNASYDVILSDTTKGTLFKGCYILSTSPDTNVLIASGCAENSFEDSYLRIVDLDSGSHNTTFKGCMWLSALTKAQRITGAGSYRVYGGSTIDTVSAEQLYSQDADTDEGAANPVIFGDGTGGTANYTLNELDQVRTGKLVYFNWSVNIASWPSTPAGSALVSGFHNIGLPADTATATYFRFSKAEGVVFSGTNNELLLGISPGAALVGLYEAKDGAGISPIDPTRIATNTVPARLSVSGVYLAK